MPTFGSRPGTLLQTILENVGAGIAILDVQGKFVFANRAALSMFGMRELQQPLHFDDWCREYRFQDSVGNELPPLRSAAMRTLAGEQVEPQDLRATLPDGRTKWIHTSAHKFTVMGIAGVLIIITDETVQVELRRTAAQLQRMEDVGAIAAGLAHNFNNILSTISLNVDVALMEEEKIPESTRGRLQQISEASWKAAGLVKRLMQFSRRRELQVRPVQINWVVSEVLNLVRPVLRNVQVRTDLGQDIPDLEVDPVEIEQVLVNIIVNARDAMPEGGELTISTEVEDIASTAASSEEPRQQFVIITIADTGTGIPEDIQSRIFEPFFTTKTTEKGTGLGLSSAYGIVQQHHGKISVWSEPGKGTKFTIRLPVRKTLKSEISTAA
jgi:two-component system cell cycle sensor histidine kinase/response regulator CckA